MEKLRDLGKEIEAIYKDIKPMSLTVDELRRHQTDKICHICRENSKRRIYGSETIHTLPESKYNTHI